MTPLSPEWPALSTMPFHFLFAMELIIVRCVLLAPSIDLSQ